ncbi:DUF1127 domain-containing protein [Bradyrhizobium sp. dw_411]|uniref:DUF1127 domain-containing protein n=1 Tax=Bradyrhizobium sp. dw_411 TaxID=2720082 RepID=UPI001BCC4841|nr:DUF1127 domain-containing protein [Bradyrhizobium sp. dw_411]
MAVLQLLSNWLDGFANYLVRRAAIMSLHELDDRALRDIGLHRTQIDAAVRGFIRLPRPNPDGMTTSPGGVGASISSWRQA